MVALASVVGLAQPASAGTLSSTDIGVFYQAVQYGAVDTVADLTYTNTASVDMSVLSVVVTPAKNPGTIHDSVYALPSQSMPEVVAPGGTLPIGVELGCVGERRHRSVDRSPDDGYNAARHADGHSFWLRKL
jgi:hypothetical protein